MLLDEMKGSGTHPNMFTLSSALKACATMGFKELGRQLHSSLIKMDADSDLFAAVGVVHMYSTCEMMDDARRARCRYQARSIYLQFSFKCLWKFICIC